MLPHEKGGEEHYGSLFVPVKKKLAGWKLDGEIGWGRTDKRV